MSNTRRAPDNAPLSQERYLSSPEYAELRGLSGSAVCAKAEFLQHPRQRSLLYFLAARSLEPRGLAAVAEDLLAMFPERIGTALMHKAGLKPGKAIDSATARQIQRQLEAGGHLVSDHKRLGLHRLAVSAVEGEGQPAERRIEARRLHERCAQIAKDELPKFLIDLCINPKVEPPIDNAAHKEVYRYHVGDLHPEIEEREFTDAEFPFFRDVVGALLEYQQRFGEMERDRIANTEVAGTVFATLDAALRSPKLRIIEGAPGIGKSAAAEAWCRMHLGESRYIKLTACMNKTIFHRALCQSLGLGCSYARSTADMQVRACDVLQRSKLILVLDEAHHLLSAARRVYVQPELLDWIYSACTNFGVPVVLLTTALFQQRVRHITGQLPWNFDQFHRRIDSYVRLPEKPSDKDLGAVAARIAPDADKRTVKFLVAFAAPLHHPLSEMVGAVEEAREVAAGRPLTFEVIERVTMSRMGVSAAKATAFIEKEKSKRASARRGGPARRHRSR